ncbi:hypothetical protein DNTS_017878 [Danionella cerebrum]|uniref:Uncharacterized protein n=1 Tax=Danionella cerebrum TaxID=2873325 RepID=A0A553N228_9TELE|nr:hypothetical protein DNTS_017878 [Danionella translucida]
MALRAMNSMSLTEVVKPLNKGIVSIWEICNCLMHAPVNQLTGMCSNYKEIRKHIENAAAYLKKSESRIKVKLQGLDFNMERLAKEKSRVQAEKNEKQLTIENLKIKKNSAKESLKTSRDALEQAEKNVELSKEEIQRGECRKETGKWVTIAGVCVTAVPVVGWLTGPAIISDGLDMMDGASKAIKEAQDELGENKAEVEKNYRKISKYKSRISEIEEDIEKTDEKLGDIMEELEDVKQNLVLTSEIQEMVRRAVTLLDIVTGRVNVLEKQTQQFILWKPVVKVMEDVVSSVGKIAQNQLLYSRGAASLIHTLRENVEGLLALCNSAQESGDHEDYY